MILQALVKRYEDAGRTAQGWQERAANFSVSIDTDGKLLDIVPLPSSDGKKNRQTFVLPEEPSGRTSGVRAAFLCDNSQYIFGLFDVVKAAKDNKTKERASRAVLCHDASKELHREILDTVNSDIAKAIVVFFETAAQESFQNHPRLSSILSDAKSADEFYKAKFLFRVNGQYAHEDKNIIAAWNERAVLSNVKDEQTAICLVSGKGDVIAELHGKVALQGVSMGAVPFVSINSESFASYGKSASDPAAQIGEKTAFAYVTALNDLLKSSSHHQRIGIDTVVYWAEGGGEEEAAAFSWTMQPSENDTDKLSSMMSLAAQGKMINIDGCDLQRTFYLLGLSPNAGRISARFFVKDSFGKVLNNILRHYRDMETIAPKNDKFLYPPPWVLLSETTVSKKAADATPLLGGQLLNSIITGVRYPATLYNAILIRIRAGEAINKTKAAIIKAILIRNYNESEVTTVTLNPESTNKPYVLGRLFSVLEQLQSRASGGSLNSTIRDRYFSSACANPKNVFPTILKLSMNHAAKLDNSVYFEKLKTSLLGKLDEANPFPAALSLDDQGRFILGYYHQTQEFYKPKTDKTNNEEETNV